MRFMTLALAVFEIYKLKLAYIAKQQVTQTGNNCSPESQLCHENILNSSQVRKSVFYACNFEKVEEAYYYAPNFEEVEGAY